jgi:hypothetical protein
LVNTDRFELRVKADSIGDADIKFSIQRRGGNGYPYWYQVRVEMNDGAGKALHNTLSPENLVQIAGIMQQAVELVS